MGKYYEVDNLLIYRDEGYCVVKETGEKFSAPKEALTNLLRSYWREIKAEKKYREKCLYYNAKTTDGAEYLDFISAPSTYDPEAIVEKKEFYNIMNDAIKNFPARTREVGQLYFFDELTEMEIAEYLGISHQVVHYQKKIFLKKLKENEELVAWCEEEFER